MKYSLELLRADLEDELGKIARLEQSFIQAESKLVLSPNEVGDYDRAAIGIYCTTSITDAKTPFVRSRASLRTTWVPRPGTRICSSA